MSDRSGNPLFEKLEQRGLSDKEHDRFLIELWKQFHGSDPYWLLHSLITRLESLQETHLLQPELSSDRRAYLAGSVAVLRTLLDAIEHYASQSIEDLHPPTEEEPPGDYDASLPTSQGA